MCYYSQIGMSEIVPGFSCRKVARLNQLVHRVEQEDAHGEEEEGGEGPLVDRLGRVHGGHRAVLRQVLLLELAHQLGDAGVRVLPHRRVDGGQNLPQIHVGTTLRDVPAQRCNGFT